MTPSTAEIDLLAPGDDLVPDAQVVMDRAFDLAAPPTAVWPWLAQLGKNRAGWYLPHWLEVLVPRSGRGLRHIDPAIPAAEPGDVIDDWGGRDATFEIVTHEVPTTLVHWSRRGRHGTDQLDNHGAPDRYRRVARAHAFPHRRCATPVAGTHRR